MAGAPLRPVAAALTGVGLRATAYDRRLVMHATRIALAYLKVHGVPLAAPQAKLIADVREAAATDIAAYDAMKET